MPSYVVRGFRIFGAAALTLGLILIFLILFIQKRPRGLFALRGRAVET